MKLIDWFHPITRRRIRRFLEIRRASWSLVILAVTYGASLGAELFCNQDPLYLRFEGRHYFPIFRFYSERSLWGEGPDTRPNYKALVQSERFRADKRNRVWWPLIPFGPTEIIQPDQIALPDRVLLRIRPEPRIASINLTDDLRVTRGTAAGFFFNRADGEEEGLSLTNFWTLPAAVREGLSRRFRNEAAPAVAEQSLSSDGRVAEFSLAPFSPRAAPPRTIRLTLRDVADPHTEARWWLSREGKPVAGEWPAIWRQMDDATRGVVLALATQRFLRVVDDAVIHIGHQPYRVRAEREDVRFPFRPVAGHPLGIDNAGRDVLARLIYGYRTSMSFGMLLVLASLTVGTLVGGVQGYFGGRIDMIGQRLIEIWDALPFLYIMILMGSIYGRGFLLLLICFALFNWVGISYYMRAEFLRLRHWAFVEAARAQGLPARLIMFRHILPNALVPLVTFSPFALVSAIGTLVALDFLGFGLPPPTPSWGELLAQAQEYPWAWWLTVYPTLALFGVMLLGVFIGEGVRQAFDPKPYSRME